ncbi:hypothetical protein GLYMA_12G054600v4 [Glycine max]|uniref:Beta-glucosidase n=2 Tax=Glycine subgen. Soja TaxID=1462606 RepID=K7LT77_SOYBN|nr:hypothetical protein GYH30_032791 [Glycine max]KRH24670.1 hypothetical protein GLYMA_12G054600v4 [Glycine max]
MSSEPCMSSHYQLLAHAAAVKIYKTYASQNGLIGITLNCHWFVPFSNDTLDHQASQRALDFMFGWFMQPLTTGNYPETMQSLLGSRLPNFTGAIQATYWILTELTTSIAIFIIF